DGPQQPTANGNAGSENEPSRCSPTRRRMEISPDAANDVLSQTAPRRGGRHWRAGARRFPRPGHYDARIRRSKVMTLDPRRAALALHRFGFGPRAGTIAAIASDPRGALLAELDKPNAGKIPDAGLMSSGAASRMTSDFIAERAAKQKLETKRQEAAKE